MEQIITAGTIGVVAGDPEALLNENQSAINEAYINVGDLKVSLSISFMPAPQGVEVETAISFSPEYRKPVKKITARLKRTIGAQGDLLLEVSFPSEVLA